MDKTMRKPKRQLTLAERYPDWPTCNSCGTPMWVPAVQPTEPWECAPSGQLLPDGITAGNRRMFVRVHGAMLHVCQNCRYDRYGAW